VSPKVKSAFERAASRLDQTYDWFPMPALISFVLATILVGKGLPGLNPRVGFRSHAITYASERQGEGSLLLSLRPSGEELIVSSSDGSNFQIPLSNPSEESLADLKRYLRKSASKTVVSSVISNRSHKDQQTVVLIADERLRYDHIRGVLVALAKAGVTNYGFETMLLSASGPAPKKESLH
jgi:hypothetical protein